MMQWILDILFYTVPAMEGVSYAVPAWLIPLAASAGSSLFNILGQRGETKKGNRLRDLRVGQQNKSLDAFRKAIGQIEGRADDIDDDQSMDELYGDVIQSFSDQATAGADTGIRNIMRSMMAGGGDNTGSGAAAIAGLTEGKNRSISDIVSKFTELTDRRNLQQSGRKDNLYGTALGNRGNLFSALSGLATDAQGRVDRRSTAGRQFLMDAVGMGLQSYGQIKSNE